VRRKGVGKKEGSKDISREARKAADVCC
jgi:hypothetical protein